MNLDDYRKSMAHFRDQQQKIPTVSEARDGDTVRQYVDARRYQRFGAPNSNRIGATKNGMPVHNQHVVLGEDPFKKFMHASSKKTEKEPDFSDAYKRLFQLPKYDENFYPLHDILGHPHWSGEAKTRMLQMCLTFSQDVDRPLRGLSMQTPLERAFELADKKTAAEAVNILVHHGADINKPNAKGMRAMHQAALHGHPELMAMLAMRGGQGGLTGAGRSVADMAMENFRQAIEKRPMKVVRQSDFEDALETYYKSMANIKRFKLHEDEWNFDAHQAKLKELVADYPGYKPYIDTMAKSLNEIEPLTKYPSFPPARPYTNPCNGLNDPVLDEYQHPWLGAFRFLDDISENMQRATILLNSEKYVASGFRDMDQLTETHTIEFLTRKRKDLDLDIVIDDKALNPHGDTLFTKCIREGKFDAARSMMELHVNLHATDKNGDTAMHILAKNCKDKDDFFLAIKQMVGTPGKPGPDGTAAGRTSLLSPDVGLADWYFPNSKGQTFMDVLYEQHPEWRVDPRTGKHPEGSWIPELEKELGVVHVDTSIPPWSPNRVLQLGGPEEYMRLGKNPDPLLLEDRTLPKLEPLDAYATKADRDNQVLALCGAVSKLHDLKKDASPQEMGRIRERLALIVESQDAETKMRALLVFTSSMDKMNASQMEGQTTIMQSITHTMKNGSDADKQKIFDAFNEASLDVQSNVVHFLEAQGVLMQGDLENASPEEQHKLRDSVEEFKNTATLFTKQMSTYAEKVYGSNDPEQEVTDVEIKRSSP